MSLEYMKKIKIKQKAQKNYYCLIKNQQLIRPLNFN